MPTKTILFVCTGNTCRSPLAQALATKALTAAAVDGWTVASAGLSAQFGMPASKEACAVARDWGLDVASHRAEPLSQELLAEAELVLVMTDGHKTALTSVAPAFADKIYTIKEFVGQAGDVSDPFGRGISFYQKTAEELRELITQVVEKIKESKGRRIFPRKKRTIQAEEG